MTDMTTNKAKVLPKQADWGVYVYMNADGSALSDSEGRVLSMNGVKGDREAIKQMKVAGASLGSLGGKVAFIPGSRQVSDYEHDDQMEAFIEGDDVPGDLDI
jgi:hypothetical protein